ncbi:hypothetical protein ACJX0J_010237, partial [Zea mays]
ILFSITGDSKRCNCFLKKAICFGVYSRSFSENLVQIIRGEHNCAYMASESWIHDMGTKEVREGVHLHALKREAAMVLVHGTNMHRASTHV